MPSFFGKYRGKISNNLDPLQLGRVQVSVPSVLGDGNVGWAMPCSPYAGPGVGFFAIPPTGANVWVEFEGGDPNYPIWSGCFWGDKEVPVSPALPDVKVLKTKAITITMSDIPGAGGLTIEVLPPASTMPLKLVLDKQGIILTGGIPSLKLEPAGIELVVGAANVKLSPVAVSINNGALEVT